MTEIWKDIDGFSGSYQISSLGRVRSLDRFRSNGSNVKQLWKGKIIKPKIRPDGYYFFTLRDSGLVKYPTIHRLLATHFIPNPENKPEVNHIDLNKLNNNLDNLEWVTHLENISHAAKFGVMGNRKLTIENVIEIKRLRGMGVSLKIIGNIFNVHLSTIHDITKRKKSFRYVT